jgi:hypothetical protein
MADEIKKDEGHGFDGDSLVEGLIRDAQAHARRSEPKRPLNAHGKKALVVLESFATIEPEPIAWLWQGRIALGKLTLIAGDPGLGKSLITAALAASVSKGYPWPVDGTHAPMGDVILLSAEDDPADTIRPRLDAAGADCARVHVLKAVFDEDDSTRTFSLKRDIAALEEALASLPDCRLLIVDPVSAYLDGTDSHNNSDVRGLLAPLTELAGRYRIAVLLIHHLNKNAGGNALYRNIGSIAFTAAVRAAYIVAKDKDNPERRLFLPTKNNLAKDSTGLAYSVKSNEQNQPVIAWETEPVEITATEALALPDSYSENADTDWGVSVLRDILAAGSVSAADALKQAKQAGLTDKQIRRAREKLGIKPQKTGFNGGWEWTLPNEDAQDAHTQTEGTFYDKGHLGDGQV